MLENKQLNRNISMAFNVQINQFYETFSTVRNRCHIVKQKKPRFELFQYRKNITKSGLSHFSKANKQKRIILNMSEII